MADGPRTFTANNGTTWYVVRHGAELEVYSFEGGPLLMVLYDTSMSRLESEGLKLIINQAHLL